MQLHVMQDTTISSYEAFRERDEVWGSAGGGHETYEGCADMDGDPIMRTRQLGRSMEFPMGPGDV